MVSRIKRWILRVKTIAVHRTILNIPNALFQLNGTVAADDTGPSTALAATLAAAARASSAQNRADFVENLWNTPQQSGTYRYYQETVYTLGLLATAGWFGYEWAPAQ